MRESDPGESPDFIVTLPRPLGEYHDLTFSVTCPRCDHVSVATTRFPLHHLNSPQPPGATIPPNQGVGMGEGEKVAQNGAEEVGEGFQWSIARLDSRVSQLRDSSDERFVQIERNLDALRSRVVRNEEVDEAHRLDRTDFARPRTIATPSPRPSCDCPHEMRSRRVSFDDTDFAGHRITAVTPPFVLCDPHDYCGPRPCPTCSPAPPPSAEPAAETSSGRESCGEGTAGSAGVCCEEMEQMARWGWISPDKESGTWWAWFSSLRAPGLPEGSTATSSQPLRFCPWCASPLREDGELRVGKGGEGS